MGKVSKATKKFQSKHLKRAIDHRKELKKHNKKIQGRRGNKTEQEKRDNELTKDEQKILKSSKENVFKDMDVEQFFEKGFDIPKHSKVKSKNNEDDNSSSEEDVEPNMGDLVDNDPEFYKYLQENDKELLDFKPSNPLDEVESDEGEESKSNEKNSGDFKLSKTKEDKIQVDSKLTKKWKDELQDNPSLKLIRHITSAFKASVNINKEDLVEQFKFVVVDEKAFHELIFIALKDLPQAIIKMAPYKIIKNSRTLTASSKVTKLSSILKSHASSLITLLNDITNTETAALVLHSTDQLLPYFLSHRKVLKEIINAIIDVWATTRDVETQIAAFAFLNNSSREFKKSLLELILKTTYSTFIKSCRKTNIRMMPLINFQKNSSVELFGIDPNLGYQIAFDFIRQLAIHLRNTMNATTKKSSKVNASEAYKIVYNWQFCHSLDFWSRVVSIHCNPEKEKGKESPLRQLIYPLVQITLGVIRLIPTPQFFPLRFYLIRSLIRISQNTGVFIPIYPLLSEILSSTAFTKSPKKKSTLAAFDFDHNIKCTEAYLGTRIYQDGLSEQFVELLGEFYVLYCKNVSFPELVIPATISLRRYIKKSKNIKFNKMLSGLIEKLNQNMEYIQQKRSSVEFGPNNRTEVLNFLSDVPWETTPLGSYIAIQREIKEEKAQILRESLLNDDEKKNQSEEDDIDIEDASEEDEDTHNEE